MRNFNIKKYSQPRRRSGEKIVQNDLSYTPSQMMDMAEKGIAVSNNNVNSENFFDGVGMKEGTFELPIDRMRGVDIADCWNAEMSIKKKAKNGLKADIKIFGNNVQKGE